MSAHESMEHAEHVEHASGENKKIALLIAVIALFLALSETLGKGAQTEAISKNVEAANLWAFFQAKSIRRTVVQTASDQSKLSLGPISDATAKAALQKQIDDWQKTAARYLRPARGPSNLRSAPSTPRKSATSPPPSTIISSSPRRRFRSALCWRRQPLSLGYSHWRGFQACWRLQESPSPHWAPSCRICCICIDAVFETGRLINAPRARSCGNAGSAAACALTSRCHRHATHS
jgi:hypothetical protein